MQYTLKVTETGNKAAKFLYEVIDENGKVITSRKSNRAYVACTIDGRFFFGRLDLINKGEHLISVKYQMGWRKNRLNKMVPTEIPAIEITPIAYK